MRPHVTMGGDSCRALPLTDSSPSGRRPAPPKKNSLSRGAHHAPQEREFFSSGFRASSLGRSETTVETKGEADEDEEDAAIGHSGSGGD